MDRQVFKDRGGEPRSAGAQVPHADEPGHAARAECMALVLDVTRFVLRASTETDLKRGLCPRLVQPRLYAESCLTLPAVCDAGARRSFYAGADARCLAEPELFWSLGSRASALEAALRGTTPPGSHAAPGCVVFPLRAAGRVLGALALTADGGRGVGPGELAELQAFADDVACTLARLRAEAPQRGLAVSERRLRETFDNAGVGITRIDMEGRFIEVNQKFCDMLGYTREELVGRPTREFTVPEDFGAGPAFRAQAQRGRATLLTGEKRYVRKDGSRVWVRRTMSATRDEHGEVRDGISVVEDITERKVAEEAARSERALLRTIIDAVPHYIYVKDVEGHFTLANKAWLEGVGRDFAEVLGKTAIDLFPPAAAQAMEVQDRAVLAGEWIADVEQCTALAEGEPPRWSSTTKVPLHDGAGRVIGLVGISRDITDRRRMERERAMEHVVARVLSESRSIEDTMPRLIRTVCDAMGWVYGAHWTWDASAGLLRRAGWWCAFEPQFDPADDIYWKEISAPTTNGLIGNTWIAQQATWMTDIAEMPGFKRAPSCARLEFRSAFAFPIHAQDEAVGVIEFFGREVRAPDEALLQVSGALSRQIGQFIRRKQAEESLQESELQLRAMFENADVGIAMTALDMRYMRVNDKYCSIVGYTREELLGMRVSEVNLESNVRHIQAERERMLSGDVPSLTVEKQLVRSDGSLVWVSLARSLVRSADGTPRHFIAVIQDISETKRAAEALKESEEQFRVLAHYDILTGLPNRALFYDRLTQALAQARRNRWWLAVMFIDVDRFKNVNDTFGHAAGDQLLKQVSLRLVECVRIEDTVGRLSGDEFAVVLSRLAAPVDAGTVAKKIVEQFNRPFQLEGTELFVTASVGITVFPTDTVDQDTLIRNADVAMYQAKERGRNTYQFYTSEMNRRTREMLNLEGELRRALERDEFVLHYQPKVSLTTGRVTGVEALLRWRHPERGLVPPADFIPLLEETGLVVQAGEWVLHAVCRQLIAWRARGVRAVPIAVNLSARQFLARDLGESIRSVLEQHAIAPGLLEVEITESAIMSDTEEANRTLEYLNALGVRSAIDDFGTGYSSLGYLKRFPLGALKVDRSFVSDITTDTDDAHITQAVISMAHSLGLKVIAEGVETAEQLGLLLRYGCDEVQGFLFARPIPGDECAVAIADDKRYCAIIDAAATTKS